MTSNRYTPKRYSTVNPRIFVLISQILIKQSYKFSEAKDGLIWYCARIAFFRGEREYHVMIVLKF